MFLQIYQSYIYETLQEYSEHSQDPTVGEHYTRIDLHRKQSNPVRQCDGSKLVCKGDGARPESFSLDEKTEVEFE